MRDEPYDLRLSFLSDFSIKNENHFPEMTSSKLILSLMNLQYFSELS